MYEKCLSYIGTEGRRLWLTPFGIKHVFKRQVLRRPTAVVNAANFLSGPISPGEVVTIGGTSLGMTTPAGLTLDQFGKVATTLAGVQLLFNGTPARLLSSASTSQTAY